MTRYMLPLLTGLLMATFAFADCVPYSVESFTQGVCMNGQTIEASRSNPDNALGAEPDRVFFSMGFTPGGEIVFALDQAYRGGELTVWETTYLNGNYCLEEAEVYVGDGSNWTYLGLADNDRGAGGDYHPTAFDLSSITGCYSHVRLVDVTSLSAGCPAAGDGFDLDAICVAGAQSCVTADAREVQRAAFGLRGNYPNPFNPTTTIGYTLPETGYANLRVVNVQGQTVSTLVNGLQAGGEHDVSFDASELPSGVYFSILQCGEYHDVRKMTLIR